MAAPDNDDNDREAVQPLGCPGGCGVDCPAHRWLAVTFYRAARCEPPMHTAVAFAVPREAVDFDAAARGALRALGYPDGGPLGLVASGRALAQDVPAEQRGRLLSEAEAEAVGLRR